jgi:NADH-quinone oxidoreductase subunit E
MNGREMKNAPSLIGWALAVAIGIVAFGVAIVVGEYDLVTSAFISVVLIAVVGLIVGMPWASSPTFDDLNPVRTNTGHPAGHAPKAGAPLRASAVESAAKAPAATPAAMTSAPLMAAAAVASTEGATSDVYEGPLTEPVRLTAARGGKADNLKEIEGIGPALEKLCNELGFYHFDQIANWTNADVAWVDQNMKNFKGRILRDKWVAQAKLIVAEGLEAFRIRAKTNDY